MLFPNSNTIKHKTRFTHTHILALYLGDRNRVEDDATNSLKQKMLQIRVHKTCRKFTFMASREGHNAFALRVNKLRLHVGLAVTRSVPKKLKEVAREFGSNLRHFHVSTHCLNAAWPSFIYRYGERAKHRPINFAYPSRCLWLH